MSKKNKSKITGDIVSPTHIKCMKEKRHSEPADKKTRPYCDCTEVIMQLCRGYAQMAYELGRYHGAMQSEKQITSRDKGSNKNEI